MNPCVSNPKSKIGNPKLNGWGGDRLRDFSLSASNGKRAGVRCRSLAPPAGNANYAWVQHFIHHLAPASATGCVLANGNMFANQSGEGVSRHQTKKQLAP